MNRRSALVCNALALLIAALPASAITIEGVVRDDRGEVVESAKIWVVHDRGVTEASTDASGEFLVADLRAGEIDLVIYKEGFALGGATAPLSGDDNLEFMLAPAAEAVARIVGPAHSALEGARLRMAVLDDGLRVRVDELAEYGLPSVRSSGDGRMVIPWARPGGFVAIVASHTRYADAALDYLPVGDAALTLMLPEGAELRGRITGPGGGNAAGARVEVYPASGYLDRVFTTVRADAEGFYNVRLPSGAYRVMPKHPEFVSPPPPRADLRFRGADTFLDIPLQEPGSVSGRVLDENGGGIANIHVSYWMEELPYARTVTSSYGTYRFQVPVGEGRVHIEAPVGYMRDDPVDAVTKLSAAMAVEMKDVGLRALPVIRGSVVNEDGEPVAHAIVQARNLGLPVWQVADETGAFNIQLAFEPQTPNVLMNIQDPRRFQRADFEAPWRIREPIDTRLTRFKPNTAPCDPDRVLNTVDKLRGEPAPEWSCTAWIQSPLRDEESGAPSLALDDLQGKVVVLTLWGGFDERGTAFIWMQWLNLLNAAFESDDQVAFVAIHDGVSELSEVAEFVDTFGIQYAVGVDGDGATFDRYDTNVIPQTFLIDKQGVLRYYDVRGRLLELIKSLRIEG